METKLEMFTVMIAKIGRCIYKIKAKEMAEFNLKSSHVSCLYYLYKVGPLTAKELCDISSEDKANISRSIKYLENEGYLYCNCSKAKRYQAELYLTEKGESLGRSLAQRFDVIQAEAGKGISDGEMEALYKSLALVCDNLEAICKNGEGKK